MVHRAIAAICAGDMRSVYAVLHSQAYRKKYVQNLKREFPRIPFYDDVFQWSVWGKELMNLHINYEIQEPFPLERVDIDLLSRNKIKQLDFFSEFDETANKPFTVKPKKKRADKGQGIIEIDTQTTLSGVPSIVRWSSKNRQKTVYFYLTISWHRGLRI